MLPLAAAWLLDQKTVLRALFFEERMENILPLLQAAATATLRIWGALAEGRCSRHNAWLSATRLPSVRPAAICRKASPRHDVDRLG